MHVWPWEKGRCFWRIKKKLNKTIPACGFLFSLLRFPQEPGRYTFIGKMVFQRKSNASPINLWNKILGQFKLRVFTTENIYSTWFTTFELAVVLMNTSENLDSIWNSGVNSPLFRQFKHQKWFHSGNFSKGKAISLCESELWTSWLQHFPYVRICLLLTYL